LDGVRERVVKLVGGFGESDIKKEKRKNIWN